MDKPTGKRIESVADDTAVHAQNRKFAVHAKLMPVSCSRITDASADSGIPPPRQGEHGAHQIGQLTCFPTVLYANPLQMAVNIHYVFVPE